MEKIKYVAYTRVSTKKQGRSGLGLKGQLDLIEYHSQYGEIIAKFKEVYTGTELSGCVELWKAIDMAKKNNAKLILARSDRFRNAKEALDILDKLGEGNLVCCDIPEANRFTFTIFFAIAELAALNLSIGTKSALKQSRLKGIKSGRANPKYGLSNPNHNQIMMEAAVRQAKTKNETKIYAPDTMALAKVLLRNIPDLALHNTPEPLFFLNWRKKLVMLSITQKKQIVSDIQTFYSELYGNTVIDVVWLNNRINAFFKTIENYNKFHYVN